VVSGSIRWKPMLVDSSFLLVLVVGFNSSFNLVTRLTWLEVPQNKKTR